MRLVADDFTMEGRSRDWPIRWRRSCRARCSLSARTFSAGRETGPCCSGKTPSSLKN